MQDIHSLTGGGPPAPAERLFVAAVAAAGDRPLLHTSNQALKCPRCDSLNTKFCYYNNYNLSQPRHFCKSCRRYWTKGGFLRNVPVGGGCRKSKRSSSASSSSSSKSSSSNPAPPSPSLSIAKSQQPNNHAAAAANNNNNNNNNSRNHSSSDSPMIPVAVPPLFPGYGTSCVEKQAMTRASSLYGVEDTAIDHHHHGGDGWRDDVGEGMLTRIGNIPSLIGSTAKIGPFGYGGLMSQREHEQRRQQQQQQQDMVVVEGFGPLDWEGSGGKSNSGDVGEEGMFELTGAFDHAFWSQQNQWNAADDVLDHHHQGGGTLFLP